MGGIKKPKSRKTDGGAEINDESHDDGYVAAEAEACKQRSINKEQIKNKIQHFRNDRKKSKNQNLTVIKRSQNVFQAIELPKVLNLNPRSAMNKIQVITTFIEEEDIDIAFISESHDRENKKLEDNIKLETHTVISN